MVYNSSGYAFEPIGGPFAPSLTIKSSIAGLTAAQCASTGYTASSSITTAVTLVEAGTPRKSMTIIVPTDAQPVTFGNDNSLVGTIGAPPAPPITPAKQTFTPPASGFTVPPGSQIVLTPYNDPLYAIVPVGTAVIYFVDA